MCVFTVGVWGCVLVLCVRSVQHTLILCGWVSVGCACMRVTLHLWERCSLSVRTCWLHVYALGAYGWWCALVVRVRLCVRARWLDVCWVSVLLYTCCMCCVRCVCCSVRWCVAYARVMTTARVRNSCVSEEAWPSFRPQRAESRELEARGAAGGRCAGGRWVRPEGHPRRGAGLLCEAGVETVEWNERKSEGLKWGFRVRWRLDTRWPWAGDSEGVSQERPESGLGECPGPAAVRAAGRAGTEPGRPRGPGAPARPAPAAKLKGGRSLSSPLPIAPPRAPGGA